MIRTGYSNRSFSGKLLLMGEHSVIDGSKALVIPWPEYSGGLEFMPPQPGAEQVSSNRVLFSFAPWLEESRDPELPELNISGFLKDIDQGLYFRSSIPQGYGLGSSGALCAAVYEKYGRQENYFAENPASKELLSVRKQLAAMESWFHGTSSGIDPLCIYFSKPLIIEGKDDISLWKCESFPGSGLYAFLLDTGMTGNTAELVKAFRKKLQGQNLKESFTEQYIPLVNEIVDQFLEGRPEYDSMVQLSMFQWTIFQELIPEKFREVWQYGLDWEYYTCKLLGSGGGGYILGFTRDYELARQSLREHFNLEPVEVKIG
jgi:mevalonate kinase